MSLARLLALAACVACSRKMPQAQSSGAHWSMSPDRADREIARAYCGFIRRCCPDFVRLSPEMVRPDCEEREMAFHSVQPLQGAGRFRYDEQRIRRCVDRINQAACSPENDLVEMLRDCEEPWIGTVPTGGRCASSAECVAGHCDRAQALDEEGVCQADAPEGASCARRVCARKLACHESTCVRVRGLGEPCQHPDECGSDWCRRDGSGGRVCANSHCGLYPGHYFLVTGKEPAGL